jgi:hypothetical protein
MEDRRAWTGRAVDRIMSYWLHGFRVEDDDVKEGLMEWWTDDDGAADAAHEIVHMVRDAIYDAGFEIVERRGTGNEDK